MAFEFRHPLLLPLYGFYAAASLLLIRLPYWLVIFSVPSWRPRPSWTLVQSLMVRITSFCIDSLFETTFAPLLVDPLVIAKSGEDVGLVWIDPAPELIQGEIKEVADINNVQVEVCPGYWYGERGPNGEVGQPAGANEKVLYHIHGKVF